MEQSGRHLKLFHHVSGCVCSKQKTPKNKHAKYLLLMHMHMADAFVVLQHIRFAAQRAD